MLQEAEKLQLLYTPSESKPMHIVVFGSGSGTNLEALLKYQYQLNRPPFEVKALFTDRKCRFQEIGLAAKIPVIYHSFVHFLKSLSPMTSQQEARKFYDQENVRLLALEAQRNDFSIDMIFLAGYMRLIHSPLLQYFNNKIINIHPADLTKETIEGRRCYVGAHAVHDALYAGEIRTRSSIILVNEEVDGGPIIASGPWVNYEEGYPLNEERIQKHQNRQKVLSDWPSCTQTIKYISEGRIGVDSHKNVYVNGILSEKGGLEI